MAEAVHILRETIGGDNAGADAVEILSTTLGVTRSWITSHPEEKIGHEQTGRALAAAQMRARGAPIQYCVGEAAFRHLVLSVDSRVLIPRPETEMLVDLVLARVKGGSVADIGTGSGAIAISLATEGSFDRVIATDISGDALEVARSNAAANSGKVRGRLEFRLGAYLSPLDGEKLDGIVSNPPYIADGEMDALPPEVRDWEPEGALRSGADGLDATRAIIASAPSVLVPGGLLALEVDERRAGRTADILKADGSYEKIEITNDLAGRQRFVAALRR